MKIGLLFGSFNPIHTGHLIIANTVLNELPISKVWFVVSPQNPLKENTSLLHAEKRIELVRDAIVGDSRLHASDDEFKLPIPSYTIDSINYFEKTYPENSFYLIMGSDSFAQLPQWKRYEDIMKRNLIVYERPGFSVNSKPSSNIIFLRSPLLNISATEIRELIKNRKSIKYLVPENIIQNIDNQSFYR